jgi:tight adherence protein B
VILAVFVLSFCSCLLSYAAVARRSDRKQQSVALRRLSGVGRKSQQNKQSTGVLLTQGSGEVRGRLATRLLERLRLRQATELLLERAGLKWSVVGFTHRTVAFFLGGFLVFTVATGNRTPHFAVLCGVVAAAVPFLYVRRKAARRLRLFEEQFPDCLEFISRSMRAGHAFSVSMELVHREFSEPLSGEFRRTFEEQNLGQPIEIVLQKLGRRIPSLDVQFFISAVLLQKRTGGNLAELLDKLAQIIRERFKLRARIRAISAQGIMSGRILAAIPMAVGALMFVANPTYARFFIDDPIGPSLLAGSLGMQFVGYLIIRKIVKIEV